MIYDKIKIYVTKRVADILEKDAESFELFKRDGITPNKNSLVSLLLINYSEEFQAKQNSLVDKIDLLIKKSASSDKQDKLRNEILDELNKEYAKGETEKTDKAISLKPTKDTEPLIEYVEQYLLKDKSLSEYFRNMFTSYALLPQDKREEIIFKSQYEGLTNAIRSGKKVFITYRNSKKRAEISPFAFARTKEEMHVYLLAVENGTPATFRLSRIRTVKPLYKDASFDDNQLRTFDKMQKYGPQFIYSDVGEIAVKLTVEGLNKYRKIYVHRPIPKKIDGDVFLFDCSEMQVISYFERFGGDALILYPLSVRKKVLGFYNKAIAEYTKLESREKEKYIEEQKKKSHRKPKDE